MARQTEFDVIVGGGGVAGTTTAVALQQLGLSILLVEPGLHDDRRLAGEVLHPPGVRGLAELGLLGRLLPAPSARIEGFLITDGSENLIHFPYDEDRTLRMDGLGIEHRLIRSRLLDAAKELRGVTVLHGKRVTAVDQSDPSSVQVEVSSGKAGMHYRCRILVAADGSQSRIGRAAGVVSRGRRISTMFGYRLSAEHLLERGYGQVVLGAPTPILAYPINSEEIRVLFDMPPEFGRSPRPEVWADHFAALPARLRCEVEQVMAVQRGMSVVARVSSPDRTSHHRLVLVGDAGGNCHPLTASGMTRCVSDALLLRDSLAEHPGNWPRALQVYQGQRCRPQATRVVLADALREAFCGRTPEARVMRRGILVYCGASRDGRAATMALLSTADGRPLALLREMVKVMMLGFLAHLRTPAPSGGRGMLATLHILKGFAARALQYGRQVFGGTPGVIAARRTDYDDSGHGQAHDAAETPRNLPGRGLASSTGCRTLPSRLTFRSQEARATRASPPRH